MELTEISTKLEEMRGQVAGLERGIQELLSTEGLGTVLEATPAHGLVSELKDMGTKLGLVTMGLIIERVALEKTIIANLGKPGGLDDQVKQLGWELIGWENGMWVAHLMRPSDTVTNRINREAVPDEAHHTSACGLLESIRLKRAAK